MHDSVDIDIYTRHKIEIDASNVHVHLISGIAEVLPPKTTRSPACTHVSSANYAATVNEANYKESDNNRHHKGNRATQE